MNDRTSHDEHLDFVEVVEVFEREDGIYVFGSLTDAERFEDAVAKGRDLPDDESATFRCETLVITGEAAERLIAAERGDALESKGWPSVAEDVREGVELGTVLGRLREIGEGESDAAELIQAWTALEAGHMSTGDGLGQ